MDSRKSRAIRGSWRARMRIDMASKRRGGISPVESPLERCHGLCLCRFAINCMLCSTPEVASGSVHRISIVLHLHREPFDTVLRDLEPLERHQLPEQKPEPIRGFGALPLLGFRALGV